MEEKNLTPKEEKHSNGGVGKKIKNFFSDIRGEFKKIIWPTKEILAKETVVVIFTSLVIGAFIALCDMIFSNGYIFIVDFLSKS